MASMKNYLTAVAPDYSGEVLSLPPTATLVEDGGKNQKIHEADDGSEEVVDLSGGSLFEVVINWDKLIESDAGIVIDLYHNPSKANGHAYSFPWDHPTDGNQYAVKFKTGVPRTISVPARHAIKQVRLKVLGYIDYVTMGGETVTIGGETVTMSGA